MKLGYSEFSFGYAFTENLIRSSPTAPGGAPFFPNLVQEAQLGYDVHIELPGCPLFFQYKLPQLMMRKNANEISKHKLLDLGAPFFRMPLMRRNLSRQHHRLIQLEQKFPGAVFYASPNMHDLHQFNLAYSAANVHAKSVFFSPTEIGELPDDKDHSVAYQADKDFGYFCSEPRQITAAGYNSLLLKTRFLFETNRFRSLPEASRDLRENIRELVSPTMRNAEYQVEERVISRRSLSLGSAAFPEGAENAIGDILVAREMARIDLGVDVLIAQPRSEIVGL